MNVAEHGLCEIFLINGENSPESDFDRRSMDFLNESPILNRFINLKLGIKKIIIYYIGIFKIIFFLFP